MNGSQFALKLSHRDSSVSLYRDLLRQSSRLRNLSFPKLTPNCATHEVQKEFEKAQLDPKLYMKHLKFELIYIIREEFRIKRKTIQNNAVRFRNKLIKGIELKECLETLANNRTAEDFSKILGMVLEHRRQVHSQQTRKTQLLMFDQELDCKGGNKPPRVFRGETSRSKKASTVNRNFNRLPQKDKLERIKLEFNQCGFNGQSLLRRYLKKLQCSHKIPIPSLLPYTKSIGNCALPELNSLVYSGSTTTSSIWAAYDMEYLESILKPSLEYDINFHYYLEKLKTVVEKKGPFRAKINVTQAGIVPIPYIETPFPRLDVMKEIALDIKKLMRLIKVLSVWHSLPYDTTITERHNRDGSFSVKWSKGFGTDERMYPRYRYEQLARDEFLWELLLEAYEKHLFKGLEIEKLEENPWLEYVESTSHQLQSAVNSYYQKYNQMRRRNSKLFTDQKDLQHQMNVHFDDLLMSYNNLARHLKGLGICKHSEIVNSSDLVNKTYFSYLSDNDKIIPRKKRQGMPLIERLGMGKKLGDYLDEYGFHSYKWGMKFDKKLNFF